MALTKAQQDAINSVRGLSGADDEEEDNYSGGLSQAQRDAIESVRSGASTPTQQPVRTGNTAITNASLDNYKRMYNMSIGAASAIPKAAGALVGLDRKSVV